MSEAPRTCPSCGEAVEPGWKICPVCETALAGPYCPGCGRPVRENWKRCPECEIRLLCPSCGGRLPAANGRCPDCTDETAPKPTLYGKEGFVEPATGMEFVYVSGGEFLMGDTFGEGIEDEQPVHAVTLRGFFIGRTCVTQFQWGRFMGDNPSRFQGKNNPVENADFGQVQAFIEKLNAASGVRRFSLPSEAQWEYAARSGGKEELYAGGDGIDAVAWYGENSDGTTHPVAEKKPNGLGLHDMSGNVWEWCRDAFRKDAYEVHPRQDPAVSGSGEERVIRGGSWNLDAWSARCARRFSFRSTDCGPGLGFRLVLREPGT